MQFHKGDKVRFLNEKGEGVITKILGNGMVMVEVEDGFEYPYPTNQLVPTAPIEKTPEPKKISLLKENRVTENNFEEEVFSFPDGIYLAFIPQHQGFPAAGKIDVALYNHSDYDIFYTLSLKEGSKWNCIQSGGIGPRGIVDIETLTPQEIDEWGVLKTDILFYADELYAHHEPVSDQLRLKGVKFFKDSAYQQHALIGKKAYVAEIIMFGEEEPSKEERLSLTNEDIQRMLREKEKSAAPKKTSIPAQKNQQLEKEVDLHIEELLDNWSGMSNSQLLDIQLRKMQAELDEAMANRLQRIIFIHGVGNGRLKEEIHRVLSGIKGIRFHDASYQRYGFGATEVEIF